MFFPSHRCSEHGVVDRVIDYNSGEQDLNPYLLRGRAKMLGCCLWVVARRRRQGSEHPLRGSCLASLPCFWVGAYQKSQCWEVPNTCSGKKRSSTNYKFSNLCPSPIYCYDYWPAIKNHPNRIDTSYEADHYPLFSFVVFWWYGISLQMLSY